MTSASSDFEPMINAALTKYANQTGHDLRSHPLASKIYESDSPDEILATFREQAMAFDEFRNDDPKLIEFLQPVTSGLHILSTKLNLSGLSTDARIVVSPKEFVSSLSFSNHLIL